MMKASFPRRKVKLFRPERKHFCLLSISECKYVRKFGAFLFPATSQFFSSLKLQHYTFVFHFLSCVLLYKGSGSQPGCRGTRGCIGKLKYCRQFLNFMSVFVVNCSHECHKIFFTKVTRVNMGWEPLQSGVRFYTLSSFILWNL